MYAMYMAEGIRPHFVKTSGGKRNQGIQKWVIGLLVLLGFLLVGCGSPATPSKISTLGPITATGTVSATGTSLYRRGTHVLFMNGHPRFFLESKLIDLNEFQNVYAAVHGDLSPNTHVKFLPVIQVSSVDALDESQSSALQSYKIPSLSISLQAPASWKSLFTEKRLLFTLPTENMPFIAIEQIDAVKLPEGIPVRIDGRNGVRVTEEGSPVHRVYVKRLDGTVTLVTFGPKGANSLGERDAFYSLLATVRFSEQSASQGSSASDQIEGSMQPCGGPAGVLCPAGEYCEVKEMDTGIGTCRSL